MAEHGTHGSVTAGVSSRRDHIYVVDWAADEATRRGTALRLVHAHRESRRDAAPAGPAGFYLTTDDAHATLAFAVERARFAHPNLTISDQLINDGVLRALAEESVSADFLVVGRHDRNWVTRAAIGSFAGSVIGHAACPVVVVPAAVDSVDPQGPAVVGMSNGVLMLRPLAFAFDCAARTGRRLEVVHCWQPPARSASREQMEIELGLRLDSLLAEYTAQFPEVAVTSRLLPSGAVADDLEWLSRRAAIVVVGSRERGVGTATTLGPVSRKLLRTAKCPVAVVPTLPDSVGKPLMRSIGHGLWSAPDLRSSRELG